METVASREGATRVGVCADAMRQRQRHRNVSIIIKHNKFCRSGQILQEYAILFEDVN